MEKKLSENSGWGTWIRTKILGVRVRCSTVELFPNIFSALQMAGGLFPLPDTCWKGPIRLTRYYLAKLFFRCQPILQRRLMCCL